MNSYNVQFVYDYCILSAHCNADSPESAPDLAWDWIESSGFIADKDSCIEIIVRDENGEIA